MTQPAATPGEAEAPASSQSPGHEGGHPGDQDEGGQPVDHQAGGGLAEDAAAAGE